MSTQRRLVIKIGSAILAGDDGGLDLTVLDQIISQVAALAHVGTQVVLVSSGAILTGLEGLGLKTRPRRLPKLQAAASLGQGILMRLYEERFRAHDLRVAQVLLTQDDFEHRRRYVNARNTLLTLLDVGAIPIVNENDAVAVEEITFGDNDRLSALVAHVVGADALLILTDVDGLLHEGQLVDRVERITDEVMRWARGTQRRTSLGGMVSKLHAARMAVATGIPVAVANGRREGIIQQILVGHGPCTWFVPREKKLTTRKRWLAFGHPRVAGSIVVDHGARDALLKRHTSLLPSGIIECHGQFAAGSVVVIMDERQMELGRGLANYSAADLAKIRGKKTRDIASILGSKAHDEAVHRDNLVITAELEA